MRYYSIDIASFVARELVVRACTEQEGKGATSEETTQPTQEPEESTETESDKTLGIPGFPILAVLSGLILGLAMTRRR